MHPSSHSVPTSVFAVCIGILLGLIFAIGTYRIARSDSMSRTASLAMAAGAFTGTFYFVLKTAESIGMM